MRITAWMAQPTDRRHSIDDTANGASLGRQIQLPAKLATVAALRCCCSSKLSLLLCSSRLGLPRAARSSRLRLLMLLLLMSFLMSQLLVHLAAVAALG